MLKVLEPYWLALMKELTFTELEEPNQSKIALSAMGLLSLRNEVVVAFLKLRYFVVIQVRKLPKVSCPNLIVVVEAVILHTAIIRAW
jgi:hypothetical protein